MEGQMCYDCLQRRIQSDFSDKLVFSYGVSHSAFPFASRAVVQMTNSSGEASSEFILTYMPRQDDDCLTKYIEDHVVDDLEQLDKCGISDQNEKEDSACSSFSSASKRKNLSISSNGGIMAGVHWFSCCNSSWYYSGRLSCLRTMTAIAPCALVGSCSYSIIENIASSLTAGSLEDDILHSISLLIEGKATWRAGENFFCLVGIPSFQDYQMPGCLRHPNLVPMLGLLKAPGYTTVVYPTTLYTLENILHYCPEALLSEWHARFLIYQLVSAIGYIHGLGLGHGNICPSTMMMPDSCWVWLSICERSYVESESGVKDKDSPVSPILQRRCSACDCLSQSLYADLNLSPLVDWRRDFHRWWRGELSNFEYLLVLNRQAGRRWGDQTFHTVMPWVIDFTVKPDEQCEIGWRDLTKSKWRLAKGDEQLDFTYSTSDIPHHVSDECLSELAVCSYKARRLPLSVLRLAVRSVYEPNEYPSTMQRLYQWTPDECIPEFYCDPQIFFSIHSGMNDLAVPSWAGTPEEFIKLHRDALESERVSCEIHNWIDITFGYKMSGQAAIAAKNVMLPSSQPAMPKSTGRRQLFTQPHPVRWGKTTRMPGGSIKCEKPSLHDADYLEKIEVAAAFCEHARHLCPIYSESIVEADTSKCSFSEEEASSQSSSYPLTEATDNQFNVDMSCGVDCNDLLEYLEDDESSNGYQDLLRWGQHPSFSKNLFPYAAKDIFSLGCIIAELYLKKPLFDPVSLSSFMNGGPFPEMMSQLPPHVKFLVEACIQKDWRRRPTAKSLLKSTFFPGTVKSSYLFIAPLQLLAKDETRLCYAANFAKKGALRAMGTFAAETCAAHCLPLLQNSLSNAEAEWAYILFKEFLKCLKPKAVKNMVIPAIQKILQATDYSHLKVSLLQDSFVREVWNHIGKQTYLEKIHPLVISNLLNSPPKSSASAASVLLIGSSEELGVPIAVHQVISYHISSFSVYYGYFISDVLMISGFLMQTILPLIYCFGKGLCADGIDALVRIGVVLGESFTVSQIVPLLKSFACSCVDASNVKKPEPMQSWNSLALVDCLVALGNMVPFLQKEMVVKELLEDQSCLFVMILMRSNLELPVLQVAAATLLEVCQLIGSDLTALHVLPQLKGLFDEVAFSQESSNIPPFGKSYKTSELRADKEALVETRLDLVLLLYPSLASLLGIERLRQCCATWLLLEQYLLRCHNWKWEFAGDFSKCSFENLDCRKLMNKENDTSKYNPTKLLMNGVGWAVPQSQGSIEGKDSVLHKRFYVVRQNSGDRNLETSNVGKREPWFWFPSPASSWDGPDFLARGGSLKDELPWKIRASVIYSVRAHHGALRFLAVDQDECTVFTAGVGPGFKGTVQKWDFSTVDCVSGYYGHEEVVNDICILPSNGRVASCDGTIHVWNSHTGKAISIISESSANLMQPPSQSSSAIRVNSDQASMLSSYPLSSGILTSVDGSLYTCMHFLDSDEKLVAGTGNGSLRFVDATRGEKLHLWSTESADSGFPSLVSTICSCGSDKMRVTSHSWIASGLSSGNLRLFDARSGNVVASWRAHDGYVTKLAAPEDHYLVSSSLDRTLRVWDLRKVLPPQPVVYKGHSDSILDFAVWGQDVISISKNKIGLSSLSRTGDEVGQHQILHQALYAADRGNRNMSVLSSIAILPFSRLFVVGTEDGHLKICC